MNNLANFITCVSLICGFASIIFSLENRISFASWAIILSVILDGIDGLAARANLTSTDFGKELDSLADIVSFGVAPAILCYVFMPLGGAYFVTNLVLFIYLVCSMIRLARYNIISKEKSADYFSGLPITVSGGIIALFVLVHLRHMMMPVKGIFLPLILVLSFLMASNIKYLKLSGLKQVVDSKKFKYFFAVMLIFLLIAPVDITFLLFAFYLAVVPSLSGKSLSNKCS